MDKIASIDLVTANGAKSYYLGQSIRGKYLHEIKAEYFHYTGDPFECYSGYDKDGNKLFQVHALCPMVIEYQS